MEQALTAGFLPSAARSDSAPFLRTGAASRAVAVAHARMARLPVQWSAASSSTRGAMGSSSTAGNLIAGRCSYSCAEPSSSSAGSGNITFIRAAKHSSPAAGYLVTSCCACAAPSSPADGNLVISCRSPSCAASSSSYPGSALQALVGASNASSSSTCYSTGASSSSVFSLTGATSSSEAETLFVFAYPCASSFSARLQFTGAACSSEAGRTTSSAKECSARDSPPMCFFVFPDFCDHGPPVDIETSAAGWGTRFIAIREAISEEAAAGSSAVESPLARYFLVFTEGASSSAVFSAPSRAGAVFLAGAENPSPDASSSSGSSRCSCSSIDGYLLPFTDVLIDCSSLPLSRRTKHCILSGAAGSWRDKAQKQFDCRCYALSTYGKEGKNREFPHANSCSCYSSFLSSSSRHSCCSIPSPDLSRRTNHCILSSATGSWQDKAHKRSDFSCYALSADGKEGKNREFPHANSCSCYSSFLSSSSRHSCSSIPSPDLSWRTTHCILSGATGSWQDKAHKRSDFRCYALSADAKEWKNKEFVVRVCALCVLLQRSGCFDKLASRVEGKKSKINWQKLVKSALLLNCLMIGYSATVKEDKRMILLIKVIDSTMKAYKIVDEVTKLIFG